MNRPLRWHAARLRQFRYTAKQLNRLAKTGAVSQKLEEKLRRQWASLKQCFNPQALKYAVSGAALMLLMGTAQSQVTFNAPVTNPFSLVQGGSQYYQFGTAADLDGDGDIDLVTNDYYNNDRRYYENLGTSTLARFGTAVNNPFSLGTTLPLSTHFADMDNDGDLDALTTTADLINNVVVFSYQENTGTVAAPVFGPLVMSPFGITSATYDINYIAADIDGDGDLDLFAGDLYAGNINYYENTGSATVPAFGAAQTNPFGLSATYYNASPVLIDLDSDGDLDMLVAEYYGEIQYFENTGTATAPAFAAPVMNPFGLTSPASEYYVSLAEADMDNDGDMDLIMVGYAGAVYYYENTTTIVVPPDPTVEFNGASMMVNEATAGTIAIDVTIVNPNANQTTAEVRVGMASTATAGADYTFTSPTQVAFAPNSSTPITLNIPIIDDMLVEPLETIVLELTNATNGATFGNDSLYTVTIQSEDVPPPPEFNFVVASNALPESAGSFDIEVSLSAPQSQQTQVDIVSGAGSTAVFGQDYTLSGSSFIFPPNTTATQKITVTIIDDAIVEPRESLILNMTNPQGGVILGNDALFTLAIEDDDNVGIDDLRAQYGLQVVPNPASSFVEIRMNQPAPLTCTLMDIQGRVLKETNIASHSNRLDISDLPAGAYVISFSNETQSGTMKLMVRK